MDYNLRRAEMVTARIEFVCLPVAKSYHHEDPALCRKDCWLRQFQTQVER